MYVLVWYKAKPSGVAFSFIKHELLITDFISVSVRVLLDTGWKVDFPRRLEHSVNNAFTAMSP